MKPSKWGPGLMLAAALASLVPAPLWAGTAPAPGGGQAQAPARVLAAASLEELLDLQAGHPQLLEQRAGTEGGITLWYVLVCGVALGLVGNAVYQNNKNYFSNLTNNLTGGNNNNNNN